jgi:hypothetical protein
MHSLDRAAGAAAAAAPGASMRGRIGRAAAGARRHNWRGHRQADNLLVSPAPVRSAGRLPAAGPVC